MSWAPWAPGSSASLGPSVRHLKGFDDAAQADGGEEVLDVRCGVVSLLRDHDMMCSCGVCKEDVRVSHNLMNNGDS